MFVQAVYVGLHTCVCDTKKWVYTNTCVGVARAHMISLYIQHLPLDSCKEIYSYPIDDVGGGNSLQTLGSCSSALRGVLSYLGLRQEALGRSRSDHVAFVAQWSVSQRVSEAAFLRVKTKVSH